MKLRYYLSLIAVIGGFSALFALGRCPHHALMRKAPDEPQAAMENSAPYSPVTRFSTPARFMRVTAPLEEALDHATFWSRQIAEHQLFLQLGFEVPELKHKAMRLHQEWEAHRKMLKAHPSYTALNRLLPLLQKTRAFQIHALEILNSGKWIGWIFPLFMTHITLELDYLVDKLNDIPYTAEDEILFWNRINSEHATFAAHLLDPSERELVAQAEEMSLLFNEIPRTEKDMWLKISLKKGKELDQFNKEARAGSQANKVLSVIHPVLLDHVIREGERGIETLESLKESAPHAAHELEELGVRIRVQNEGLAE